MCKSCQEYTLWGDVIRGCYRRSANSARPITEGNLEAGGDVFGCDVGSQPPMTQKKSRAKGKAKASTESPPVSPRKPGRPRKIVTDTPGQKYPTAVKTKRVVATGSEEGGEFFDLNAISSDEEEDGVPSAPTIQGRSLLPASGTSQFPTPRLPRVITNTTKRKHHTKARTDDDGREFFDLNAITSDSEDDGVPPVPKYIPTARRPFDRPNATPGPSRPPWTPHLRLMVQPSNDADDDREFFDLNVISSGDEEDGVPVAPIGSALPFKTGSRRTYMEQPPIPNVLTSPRAPVHTSCLATDSDIEMHVVFPAGRSKKPKAPAPPLHSIPRPSPSPSPTRSQAKPKKRIVAKKGEVDFFDLHSQVTSGMEGTLGTPALVQAFSTLSVSSPPRSPERRLVPTISRNADVIEISD